MEGGIFILKIFSGNKSGRKFALNNLKINISILVGDSFVGKPSFPEKY